MDMKQLNPSPSHLLLCSVVIVLAACDSLTQESIPIATPRPVVKATRPKPATTKEPSLTLNRDDPQVVLTYGLNVYKKNYCGSCHTLQAANAHAIFGPPHDHIGTIAQTRLQDKRYRGKAVSTDEYLAESITNPSAFLVEGYTNRSFAMPKFKLSDQDMYALIQMLAAQK